MKQTVWYCKIGDQSAIDLPHFADQPMRRAVEKAYKELTGKDPEFLFSGWGAELDEFEREVVKRHESIQT